MAIRLKNEQGEISRLTDADLSTWLPGDILYDKDIFIPYELKTGRYNLEVGIVDHNTGEAKVRLAIAGRTADGWYPMGKVDVL